MFLKETGSFSGIKITLIGAMYFVQFFYKERIIFTTNTTAEIPIHNAIWHLSVVGFYIFSVVYWLIPSHLICFSDFQYFCSTSLNRTLTPHPIFTYWSEAMTSQFLRSVLRPLNQFTSHCPEVGSALIWVRDRGRNNFIGGKGNIKRNPIVGTYSLQIDEAIKGEKLTTKEKQRLLTFAQCESWISLWELFKFTPVRAAAEVVLHSPCPTSPRAVN